MFEEILEFPCKISWKMSLYLRWLSKTYKFILSKKNDHFSGRNVSTSFGCNWNLTKYMKSDESRSIIWLKGKYHYAGEVDYCNSVENKQEELSIVSYWTNLQAINYLTVWCEGCLGYGILGRNTTMVAKFKNCHLTIHIY